MPRFTDKDGSKLLDRLTSIENFAFHRNRSISLASRMEDSLKLLEGANTILTLYYLGTTKNNFAHREAARLLAFVLQTAALQMELAQEFITTIPKDEKYAVRMDGLKKMYSSLTTMVVGAETSLSETNVYSSEDLSVILAGLSATLSRIKIAFSSDYRTELRKKLELHKPQFKSREDVRRIDQIIEELKQEPWPNSVASAGTNNIKTVMHRVRAGVPDLDGWYRAESTSGHFTVRVPAPFNDFVIRGTDERGNAVSTSAVGMVTEEGTKYGAVLFPANKDKPTEDYLDSFAADFRAKGTLKASKRLSYQEKPALEITVGDKLRSLQARIVLDAGNVFMLSVEYDTDKAGKVREAIPKFFNSLELPTRE